MPAGERSHALAADTPPALEVAAVARRYLYLPSNGLLIYNVSNPAQHYLGGPGAYSWQGFFSTKFVNNPARDTVILTMSTPGFDGTLPHNLRMIAAATAAVTD